MAAKQAKRPLTAKEKQVMDRVQRATKSYPKVDRHGVYREACVELAEETGTNVEDVWDEFVDHPMRKDYVAPDDYEYEPTPHDAVLEKAKAHYPAAP